MYHAACKVEFLTIQSVVLTADAFQLFIKTIYRMRASGAYRDFSREAVNVFRRFVRHRARWLGWHRAGPRAVNMRAVDAATFTYNVVIESVFFFSPRSVPILYT